MSDEEPSDAMPRPEELPAATPRLNRLTGDLRDQMVAYLDGECDEETSRSIDQLLAKNEVARKEVDRLSKAYELLDFLPRPAASTDFTNATMKSVRAIQPAEREVSEEVTNVLKPWFPVVKSLALAFVCTLAGLGVGQFLFARESDAILDDLAAIENLEQYRLASSAEFVDWLSRDSVRTRLRGTSSGD